MKLILYSLPACQSCDILKAKLEQAGKVFETIDLSKDYESREWLRKRGHRSAPQLYAFENGLPSWVDNIDDII